MLSSITNFTKQHSASLTSYILHLLTSKNNNTIQKFLDTQSFKFPSSTSQPPSTVLYTHQSQAPLNPPLSLQKNLITRFLAYALTVPFLPSPPPPRNSSVSSESPTAPPRLQKLSPQHPAVLRRNFLRLWAITPGGDSPQEAPS